MKRKLLIVALLMSFTLCFNRLNSQNLLPYQNTKLSFEERAADLVSRMTLEEKISQMQYQAPAIKHLGIPEYNWWSECLHGIVG